MVPAPFLKLRWKKEMEEGDHGHVAAPPQTSGGSPVPFAAENQLALANNDSGVEIARAYVIEVMEACKARNDTLTCNKFLRLVTDLRDRGVDIDKATTCITELFQGTYNNLILRYNDFLERITQSEGDPQAITLPEEDPQAITLPEEDPQAITLPEEDPQAITLPEEDLLDTLQRAITLSEEDLDKTQHAITLPEEDPSKRQPTITLPEEDFDKRPQAIIFNGKVKELAKCKYNAVRMILHMYNNHSVTIKEVHEMAKWPFRDRSDLVQDFKTLLPDTSIIPSSSLMLVVETGQQQPPPPRKPKKLRFLVGGKEYCNTIEEECKEPDESNRHSEAARPADKARKGKEELDMENSKNIMGKRKERNWEEGSETKVENYGFEEHQSKKVSQRITNRKQLSFNDGGKAHGSLKLERVPECIAKRRQSSSNNGSKDAKFLHLNRMPKGIPNISRQLLSNDGGRDDGSLELERMRERIAKRRQSLSKNGSKDVEFPHLDKMPKGIAIMRKLLSNDGGRDDGSLELERMPERIAKRRQSLSKNGSKDVEFPHVDRMSKGIAIMRKLLSNNGGRADGSSEGLERVPERINKRIQSSSNDGSKDDGSPQLERVPKRIANMRLSPSNNGGRTVRSPQLKRVPSERIANKKLSPSNNRDKATGSPQLKRAPSERIAKRRLSLFNNGDRAAKSLHLQRMSIRPNMPMQAWKDQNIKGKVARSLSPPLQPTIAELVERLNKCRSRHEEPVVEFTDFNWYKDEE